MTLRKYPRVVPVIGTVVGARYRIERLLGEGGMGAVYEAVREDDGARVAVKVVAERSLADKPLVVARFQREARATEAFRTAHVARILDAGIDELSAMPFLVMDLLRGSDVKQLVKSVGPLRPEVALRVAAQACAGLAAAHEAGVVHRDIKSANLFLSEDAGEVTVKILDFGIAKAKMDQIHAQEGRSLTRTGSLLGTPLYMSPEQAQGEKTIDHRTDVWSLGVVLYELLSGRTPHEDADTVGKLIVWIVSRPVPSVQDVAPWVAPEIAAIVHRALERDAAARFSSAAAMLDAIDALLSEGAALHTGMLLPLGDRDRAHVAPRLHLGRASVVVGAADTAGVGATHPALARSTAGEGWAPSGRWAVAALAVVGLGGGAWALSRTPAPEGLASGSAATAPALLPSPAVTASPAEARPPVARTVRLAVAPSQVLVEVDGSPAPVVDGHVAIEGSLGTRHAVTLSLGGQSTKREVVVTENGAFPDRLGLEPVTVAPAARPTPGQRPSATPRASGPAATPAPAQPPSLTEADKFE